MQDISFISLKNNGAFVARLQFEYRDRNSNKWIRTKYNGDITVGFSKTASPGDFNIQEGSIVRLHVSVAAGSDKDSSEEYTYRPANGSTANYSISGTTLKNKLTFEGVKALILPEPKAEIEFISLHNSGAFVARLQFEYFDRSSNKWIRTKYNGDITVGFSRTENPGDFGIKDGSLVRLHASVALGSDKDSSEVYTYRQGNALTAYYSISGTIVTNKLILEGMQEESKAEIGFISFQNNGAFVARLQFEYYDKKSRKWIRTKYNGDITVGYSRTEKPGDYGVPNGSLVKLHASVAWGSDKDSRDIFTYKEDNPYAAFFSISGTTVNNSLKLEEIQTGSIAEIGYMSLQNNGGFVVKLEFEYFNKSSNRWIRTGGTGDITVEYSKTESPGDYGVPPDGSLVKLHANVAVAPDRTSREIFVYKAGNGYSAIYYISGIATNPKLKFDAVLAVTAKLYFSIQLITKSEYYVCAEDGGGRELVANRKNPLEWETFTLAVTPTDELFILRDNIKVGLITHKGQYVTAVNGGGTRSVIATKAIQGEYETFTLRKVAGINTFQLESLINSGDKVAFCCASGRHYLAATNGGGSIFTCEPPWMDVDEMFTNVFVTPQGAHIEHVMTSFVPEIHGFHFKNSFPSVERNVDGTPVKTQGRCGGMAFAALDYFYNGIAIPKHTDEVPPLDSILAKYIYDRLLDSFFTSVVGISNGAKFVEWTIFRKDFKSNLYESVPQLTKNIEFPKLMNELRNGPVVLGLLETTKLTEIGNENHQVIAIGAEHDKSNGKMTVYIYDNNHPDRIDTLTSFPADLYFTHTYYRDKYNKDRYEYSTIRGFFVEKYSKKDPPTEI